MKKDASCQELSVSLADMSRLLIRYVILLIFITRVWFDRCLYDFAGNMLRVFIFSDIVLMLVEVARLSLVYVGVASTKTLYILEHYKRRRACIWRMCMYFLQQASFRRDDSGCM